MIGLAFQRDFQESYSSQCFLYIFQKPLGQNCEMTFSPLQWGWMAVSWSGTSRNCEMFGDWSCYISRENIVGGIMIEHNIY